MKNIKRESVPHEVLDDGGLLFDVEKSESGSLSAKVRVYGRVEIDGREYGYDKEIRVQLKKLPE